MEYLPLGNLAEQNEIWRITEWETVTLLCQGLSALSYLHPKNIVHRDLKPQNILVQCREPGNFCIKIADFGLARDGSYLKTFCGTWLYAAPEIWKNRPYTAMVDIWSLGIIAFQYAYDLPKIPKVQGQFDPKRWYQRLTCLIDDWDSDGLLELLKSSMLRMDPRDRLSASECLRESAKLRETIIPAQNSELDPGTPTEAMPSSAIMRALRAAGYGGGQQVVADEAEIQTNLPTLSILKSARQPGGDRGNPEMAVGEVGTLLDFPTLPTLRSSCRPEDCPETITQIWDPPGEAACRPKEDEGSKQEVEIGTGDESGMRRSKRQRMEQPSDELLPNSQQKHWKRYEDQVLIEDLSSGCIRMVLEGKAVSLRKSDCWLNATQVLGLAASPAKDRNRILSILRQRTNIQVVRNPPQLWIPYQDGRFLCEFLQLTDTLRPLLKYGLKQGVNFDDQANYFSNPKFLEVTAGKTTVSIRSADFWINATHILKAAGCHRYEMAKVRKRVQFNVVRGNAASQGTYVDPRTGLGLCKEYGLDSLESILRSHLEGYGYRQGELRQPATTTQNPTTVEVTASLGARRDRRKKTAVRDDRPNKTRPRCNKCTEYHRKCDRSDICGCCNALGLGNILFLN
jgi:serine/threonine protein kinase